MFFVQERSRGIYGVCGGNNRILLRCRIVVSLRISARISKKVEGGIRIEIGYYFNAHLIFKGGIPYVELL